MNYDKLTKVTIDDFADAICDEYGIYYSKDYKRLLSYSNPSVKQEIKKRLSKIIVNQKTEVICENAFYNYIRFTNSGFWDSVKSEIILPDGLIIIGDNAFTASGIFRMNIPATVDHIYGNPFSYSDISEIDNNSEYFRLKDRILYDNSYEHLIHCFDKKETFISDERTKYIHKAAFARQSELRTVILSNIIDIDDEAFNNCSKLEYISLSNCLISIGKKAFKQPIAKYKDFDAEYFFETRKKHLLKNDIVIKIPTNVKNIGEEAFAGISNITSLSPNFQIIDGLLLSADGKKLYNCLSSDGVLVIPNGVEEIMDSAFIGNEVINKLIITNTVKRIGKEAFKYCYALNSVYFESSLVEFGRSAFSDCVNLENIILPKEISEIPDSAFCNCPKIASISFPPTITQIGENAFKDCAFTKLAMPRELLVISNNAFQDCNKLEEIILNEKLKEIGSFAFYECKIKELTIPSKVQNIGKYAFNINNKVTITNPQTNIQDNGLGRNWYDLIVQYPTRYAWDMSCYNEIKKYHHLVPLNKERTLEEKLSGEDMGGFRFTVFDEYYGRQRDDNNPGLYSGDMECFISLYHDYHSSKEIVKVKLDKRVKYICNGAFVKSDCGFAYHTRLKEVIMPEGVIAIGKNAFECSDIDKIILPKQLEYLGDFAFLRSSLKQIVIPEKVSHIGTNPFADTYIKEIICQSPRFVVNDNILYTSDMKRLIVSINTSEEILIPDGVVTIDDYAFSKCKAKRIILPHSVKTIGYCAFEWSPNLETMDLSNVSTVGEWCFCGCKSLKEIVTPYSDILNAYMFNHCENLSKVTINPKTQTIGESTFGECPRLHSMTIPENVKCIYESAFVGSGIKEINCETTCYEVKDNILYTKGLRTLVYCFNDSKDLVIPDGVVEVSNEAFAYRKNLQKIDFPSSLLKIGERVFKNCKALKVIDLKKTKINKLDKYTLACCDSNPQIAMNSNL